jgi:hypothetical protein
MTFNIQTPRGIVLGQKFRSPSSVINAAVQIAISRRGRKVPLIAYDANGTRVATVYSFGKGAVSLDIPRYVV